MNLRAYTIPEEYITTDVIRLLSKENTKLAARVKHSVERLYDRNDISIIKHGGVFYFAGHVPDYVRKYLIRFLETELYLTYFL